VKNKKLFAILTLVCFMFTLMPVAAFAAGEVTITKIGDTTVSPATDSEVVVVDSAVTFAGTDGGYFAVDEDGDLYDITTTSVITFEDLGTYKVYGVAKDNANSIDGALIKNVDKLELLMELDSLVEDYATVKVKKDSTIKYQIVLAENWVDTDNMSLTQNATNEYTISINGDGGWSEDGLLKATLYKYTGTFDPDADNEEVKKADLTFTTAGYVDITTEDGKTTDSNGEVEFEVTSERPSEYVVYVSYGSAAKVKLNVVVGAAAIGDVSVEKQPTAPVDYAQKVSNADVKFKFVDADGVAYKLDPAGDYKITVVDQPEDSDMDKDDFILVHKATDADGVWTLAEKDYATAEGMFEAEGTYTIKVTLENGKSATATVKVAEMGEVVGIKFDVMNTPRTVAYGKDAKFAYILAYDADGITKNIAFDPSLKVVANGVAFGGVTPADVITDPTKPEPVKVTAKNDNDYIGTTITVLAEYDNFVATTVLTVVDQATTITFADANAEVGVNTEITGTVVDNDGNRSALTIVNKAAVVMEKPENAIAVATVTADAKGNPVLNFLGSEEGTYKVSVAINDGTNFATGVATIVVGAGEADFEDIVVVSIGADKMIVNNEVVALDVAPFITNGRTMMQFNVLYVFGIDVEWVAETQSIVAEGNGLKVVMQLGSKVATVNGEEVALDVAPYTVNGRTVVPVGFITGLLDITPTFTYNADGTIADILFAK